MLNHNLFKTQKKDLFFGQWRTGFFLSNCNLIVFFLGLVSWLHHVICVEFTRPNEHVFWKYLAPHDDDDFGGSEYKAKLPCKLGLPEAKGFQKRQHCFFFSISPHDKEKYPGNILCIKKIKRRLSDFMNVCMYVCMCIRKKKPPKIQCLSSPSDVIALCLAFKMAFNDDLTAD